LKYTAIQLLWEVDGGGARIRFDLGHCRMRRQWELEPHKLSLVV
jgi:hypothetical protein